MHARTRDRGHFRTNIELMIAVAIVGILLAIAVPAWMKHRAARGETCLANVIKLAEGPLPAGTACPWSGKPYGSAPACPEPKDHLDGDPKAKKGPDGVLRLTQSLPSWTGKEFKVEEGSIQVVDAADRLSLTIRPHGGVRFVLAPLLLVFLVGVSGWFFTTAVRGKDERWMGLGAGLGFLALAVWVLVWAGGKRELTVVKRSGTLTSTESILGWKRSSVEHAKIAAVVPVSAPSGSWRRLFLVPSGGQAVSLGLSVPSDRLDAADLFQRALAP